MLRDLVPGGAAITLRARVAASMLRAVRPATDTERVRRELAHDLVRDLRSIDASVADIAQRVTAALDEHGTALRTVDVVGSSTPSA